MCVGRSRKTSGAAACIPVLYHYLEDLNDTCWNSLTPSFSVLKHFQKYFSFKICVHFKNSCNLNVIAFAVISIIKIIFSALILTISIRASWILFLVLRCICILNSTSLLLLSRQYVTSLASVSLAFYVFVSVVPLVTHSFVLLSFIFASKILCSFVAVKHCPYDLLQKQLPFTGPIWKLMNGSQDQLERRTVIIQLPSALVLYESLEALASFVPAPSLSVPDIYRLSFIWN